MASLDGLLSGESQTVEYKVRRSPSTKGYLKSVVAFANARGGTLVFGVDDKTREVVGIPSSEVFAEMDAIANAIMDSIEPQVLPEITLRTVDGKSLILVDVPAGRQCPYFIKTDGIEAGTYVRVGATSRHADLDWVRELTQECAPEGFDRLVRRGAVVTDARAEALCERMYEVARSHTGTDRRGNLRKPTEKQLLTWGILKERDGEVLPTNAFLILEGDQELVAPLQCALFKGSSRATFLDRRDIAGDVMSQVEGAYQFVLEKMNMGADLGGVVRRDVFELPEWSVREAITNAVVHRSYVERSSVQVALYDDRLEVSSPGGIVRGFSLDRALSGQSRPRNEALAQAFLYMGLIEGWGSGIPRIMHEFEERGLRAPEFQDIDGMLRVNLWRPTAGQFAAYLHGLAVTDTAGTEANCLSSDNKDNKSDNKDNMPDNKDNKSDDSLDVSPEEGVLLALIRENPSITQARMAGSLGLSRSTVALMLARLQRAGLVRREGSRKAGTWVVMDGDGR
jgi:ATP-dependent DNA helicase RecG